jgi:hypothetical protein
MPDPTRWSASYLSSVYRPWFEIERRLGASGGLRQPATTRWVTAQRVAKARLETPIFV